MKKIILMLMLLTSITTTLISCKKDEKTENEKTLELIVNAKWYYQSISVAGSVVNDCFNNNAYWEFKSDGTFVETSFLEGGTYTIGEDGKSFTLKNIGGDQSVNGTIISIDANTLKFNLALGDQTGEITLAKTAKNCILD